MLKHTNNNHHSIFVGDLEKLQLSTGLSEGIRGVKKNRPVMIGHFGMQLFEGGLSMHAMNALENQNSSTANEILPGLSFNIIFRGEIKFQFAGNWYYLKPIDENPSCTAIINNTTAIMDRKMQDGMHVKKLNIYIEKSWLYSRCRSQEEFNQLNFLFATQQVKSWLPSKQIIDIAHELITTSNSSQLADRLMAEQLTIATLNMCLCELQTRIADNPIKHKTITHNNNSNLKELINQQLEKQTGVLEIAEELNMSLRTLQRKFYKAYGKTVSSYISQRKIAFAKAALVIEGKTIGEAAYIAGYKHTSNFISAFKKHTGMTPSQFVKSHRTP